jgi:hypothetical protein
LVRAAEDNVSRNVDVGLARMALAVAQAGEMVRGERRVERGWRHWAGCQGLGDEVFFSEGRPNRHYYADAYAVCERCAVAAECLCCALHEERFDSQHHIFGLRGGLGPAERIFLGKRFGLRAQMNELVEV